MGAKYDPIPVLAQPGFLLTQSPLASKGRFTGGFGVRFRNGFPEKRAGFSALSSIALAGIPRGSSAWNDLTGRDIIGVGTRTNLYVIPATDYVPIDITPTGLPPGTTYGQTLFGYGTGYYGFSGYGQSQPGQSITVAPRVWTIGNFGRIGIFCPGPAGGVYAWDPAGLAGSVATLVPNAPSIAAGIVTTSDNIVIAYGTNFNSINPALPGQVDPLQIWNSAQGDYTNWNTLAIAGPNGAPSQVRRLNEGNQIIGAADLGTHITLFWTDFSLHALQYTGSQFVFDEYPVGLNCGLIGPMAFTIVNSSAYWMSPQGFFVYAGGVSPISNQDDIKGFVFPTLTQGVAANIICWYDQFFNEVSWAVPINGSLENSLIVVYNIAGQFWYTDTMPVVRTSAARPSPVINPIFFATDGILYQDNIGLDANGANKPWSISYAPVEAGALASAQFTVIAAQAWIEALGVFLDMQRQTGIVNATLTATDRTQPQSPVVDIGTGSADPATSSIDMRVAGRQLALTLSGDGVGCDFRIGVPRIEIGSAGIRR